MERRSFSPAEAKLFSTMRQGLQDADPALAEHCRIVGNLSVRLAEQAGMSSESIQIVKFAAPVHDFGKTLDPRILGMWQNRSLKRTPEEKIISQTHPQLGAEYVIFHGGSPAVAKAVAQHHENKDGSGYPNSLHEEEICPEARIIRIADVLQAGATRTNMSVEQIHKEIDLDMGKAFYPDLKKPLEALVNEILSGVVYIGSKDTIPSVKS